MKTYLLICAGLFAACAAIPTIQRPSTIPRSAAVSDDTAAVDTTPTTTVASEDAVPAAVVSQEEAINAAFDGGTGDPAAVVSESQSNTNLHQISTSSVPSGPQIMPVQVDPLENEMLAAVNRLRGNPLHLEVSLMQAAQDYADYLVRTRQQGHFADGDPEYRAKRAGFAGTLRAPPRRLSPTETSVMLGEVLAFGTSDAQSSVNAWVQSPGHYAALVEPTYDVAGFGRNGTVFVGMFGNSKQAPPFVAAAQPTVNYTQQYSSCTTGNCGNAGRFRIFGRRR